MGAFDSLLRNARVITLDRRSTIADALGISGGRIAAVGTHAALRADIAPSTRVLDLGGAAVIPGLFDAHPHMDREGLKSVGGIQIAGLHSIREIVEVIADAVRRARPGEWIVVMPMGEPPHGYVTGPEQLKEGRFPTRHDLDPVSPENPVYIRGVWGWWGTPPFPSVANSAALTLGGITRETPAPYNVEIQRDRGGEPTGLFLERNRSPLLEYTLFASLPKFSQAHRLESVRRGTAAYVALGTTSTYEGHGLTPALIRAYREVREREGLPVRMFSPVSMPTAARTDQEMADLLDHWAALAGGRGAGDELLRVAGVTLDLADPNVAAVIARGYPYEAWAGHFSQGLSDERFVQLGVHAARLGLRLNALVCYDLERALRLFEAIAREVPQFRDSRSVGIHLLQATDEQLRRIRDLGLVLTMTPNLLYEHAQSFGIEKLGDGAIPIRRVMDAGIPVALSTDNVPCSMLWTMWEALARRNRRLDGPVGDSHLTREEALRLSVQSGHYLTWEESERGSIEVGRWADLVVLDGDPLGCPLDELPRIGVDMVLLNGKVVYERSR